MFIGVDKLGYVGSAEGKPYIIIPMNCDITDIMLVMESMNFCSLSSAHFSLASSFVLSSFSGCVRFCLSLACAVSMSFTTRLLPSLHVECLSIFFFSYWAQEYCHLQGKGMWVECWLQGQGL